LKLSYSGYTAFLQNPEKYRLYYPLGLKIEGDDIPTFKNYGRRRGSCFHAIQEARAKGVRDSVITEHKYPDDMYARCARLAELVPDLGELLQPEYEFTVPIGDGKHSITGRIDHIAKLGGVARLGDFKTTKKRTKKEMAEYNGELSTSPQPHFYLYAARSLGYQLEECRFHVMVDDKDKPDYYTVDVTYGENEVNRKMSAVYAACEVIEFLTNTYGVEKPWPHSNNWPCSGDRFFCGYQEICGRALPLGCVPPGFVSRKPEPEAE
jgi:hypothetical protein